MFKKTVNKCVRLFWATIIISIVALAVCVQIGRATFPFLHEKREYISEKLSDALGAEVYIGSIEGEWSGLRPKLALLEVSINSDTEVPVVNIDAVAAEINILSGLGDWRRGINKLVFHGLKTMVVQNPDGKWRVNGLKPSTASNDNITVDDPLDIFLFGRRIELVDSTFVVRYRSGVLTEISLPEINLENDRDFHRLVARIGVDEDMRALSLVVEGNGDPRDEKQFSANAYLELNQFPLNKVIAALGLEKANWVNNHDVPPDGGSNANQESQNQSELTGKLWLNGSIFRGFTTKGKIGLSALPVKLKSGIELPDSIETTLIGGWTPEDGWALQLKDFQGHWADEFSSPQFTFEIEGTLHKLPKLQVSHIDIPAWRALTERINLLDGRPAEILNELDPKGLMHSVAIEFKTPQEGYFQAKAQIENASAKPWRGSPDIENVNGYIEFSAQKGRLIIDSQDGFSMHYPKVYHQPLSYSAAFGEISWHVRKKERFVYVTSGRLTLEEEDNQGFGYLYLSLPFKHNTVIEPEMTLMVGMQKADVKAHEKYVPFKIPQSLYTWIGDSVQAGEASNGAFIYRGSILKKPLRRRAIQLALNLDNGRLKYSPQWPALENLSGSLVLDDRDLNVVSASGELMGNQISDVRLNLARGKKSGKQVLEIQGKFTGTSENALALLQNSPVNKQMNGALDKFVLTGTIDADVSLVIPTTKDFSDLSQDIVARVQNNKLTIPEIGLEFSSLTSVINYSDEQGLSANKITATLWDEPLNAEIKRVPNSDEKKLGIYFTSKVDMAKVQAWSKLTALSFAEGKTSVSGAVLLPIDKNTKEIRLKLKSNLSGVAIELPGELYKSAKRPLATEMSLNIGTAPENRFQMFELDFKNIANLQLHLHGSNFVGASLGLKKKAEEVSSGKFKVDGELDEISVREWMQVINLYQSRIGQTKSASPPLLDLELAAKNIVFGDDLIVDKVNFGIEEEENGFSFSFNSAMAKGQYWLPKYESLHRLRLDYLRFPPERSETQLSELELKEQLLRKQQQEWNVKGFPSTQVMIDELRVGDSDFGQWEFEFSAVGDGGLFSRLSGSLRGLRFAGFSDEKPAQLQWYKNADGRTFTQFSGKISATDIGSVLEEWDQSRMLTSEEATFDANVLWPGPPNAISLVDLEGRIDANLKRGVFIQGVEAGNNPLMKLIGLLNFDSLARRLRLDFSDLSTQGMGYDTVTGKLQFNDKALLLEEPLQVVSPSSNLKLAGTIQLEQQTLDTNLVATLPVAGNLTVAAALTGGLPAAVGVFVVGKLFKKQVDKASSIRYKVTGDWSSPKVEVDGIFNDKAENVLTESIDIEKELPVDFLRDSFYKSPIGSQSLDELPPLTE